MRCDYPDCDDFAPFGWTAPPGYERPKVPLRACSAHREWAEALWRERYFAARPDAPPAPEDQPRLL